MAYWPDIDDMLGELREYSEELKYTKEKKSDGSVEVTLNEYDPVVNNVLKAIKENRKFSGGRAIRFKTTWYVNYVYGTNHGPRWRSEMEHYNHLLNYVTGIPNELEWDEFKENMAKEKCYLAHVEMFDCEESTRTGNLELLRPLTPGIKNKVLIAVDNNGLPHAFCNKPAREVDLFELQELLNECTKDNLEYIMAIKDIDSYIAYCRARSKK